MALRCPDDLIYLPLAPWQDRPCVAVPGLIALAAGLGLASAAVLPLCLSVLLSTTPSVRSTRPLFLGIFLELVVLILISVCSIVLPSSAFFLHAAAVGLGACVIVEAMRLVLPMLARWGASPSPHALLGGRLARALTVTSMYATAFAFFLSALITAIFALPGSALGVDAAIIAWRLHCAIWVLYSALMNVVAIGIIDRLLANLRKASTISLSTTMGGSSSQESHALLQKTTNFRNALVTPKTLVPIPLFALCLATFLPAYWYLYMIIHINSFIICAGFSYFFTTIGHWQAYLNFMTCRRRARAGSTADKRDRMILETIMVESLHQNDKSKEADEESPQLTRSNQLLRFGKPKPYLNAISSAMKSDDVASAVVVSQLQDEHFASTSHLSLIRRMLQRGFSQARLSGNHATPDRMQPTQAMQQVPQPSQVSRFVSEDE